MNHVSTFHEPTVEVMKSNKETKHAKNKKNRPRTSNKARANSQPRNAPARNTPFTGGNLLSSKPKHLKSRATAG